MRKNSGSVETGLTGPAATALESEIQADCYNMLEVHYRVVLEPDPQKIEKEGLINWLGWKCLLWKVTNSKNFSSPVEYSAVPGLSQKHYKLGPLVFTTSTTKRNVALGKTALVWLAFLMNAHQIKSRSQVCLHTRHSVHFHPS